MVRLVFGCVRFEYLCARPRFFNGPDNVSAIGHCPTLRLACCAPSANNALCLIKDPQLKVEAGALISGR